MTRRTLIFYDYVAIIIPILMMGALVILARSAWFQIRPELLANAIVFDLIFLIPMIYFLAIRRRPVSNYTTLPLIVLGTLVAGWALPAPFRDPADMARLWILPLIELSLVGFILYKMNRLISSFPKQTSGSPDFYTALSKAAGEVLPARVSPVFTTEIATLYYGLLNWRKYKVAENEFTYHRKSGNMAIWITLLLLIPVETLVLHLLLQQVSLTLAWIFTGISIYSAIQVLGIVRSIPQRPVQLMNNGIHLRYGIYADVFIPFKLIQTINDASSSEPASRRISPLADLEEMNVHILLRKDLHIRGLWGIKRKAKSVSFYLDEPQNFLLEVRNCIAT